MPFDIEKARQAGATDEQMVGFLSPQVPMFNLEKARQAGVPDAQIIDFLAPKVGKSVDGLEPITTDDGRQAIVQTGRKKVGVDAKNSQPLYESVDTGVDPTSFGALAEAASVSQPETKMKVFAKHRGISEKMYSSIGGKIMFMDDNGVLHEEKGNTPIENLGAGMVGDAPAIVGTMLGGPFGGMAAKAGHKIYNYGKYKEELTAKEAAVELGVTGLTGIGGKVIGGGTKRGVNTLYDLGESGMKGVGNPRGRYVANLIKGGFSKDDALKMTGVIEEAKLFGIDISAVEAIGDKSLIDRVKYLADLPASARTVQMYREIQDDQVESAFKDFVKMVAPDKAQGSADDLLVGASQKSVKRAINIRQGKAQPFYDKAFSSGDKVDVEPVVSFINEKAKTAKGDILQAYKTSKRLIENPDLPKKDPGSLLVDKNGNLLRKPQTSYDTSLKGLNDSKKAMGAKIQALEKSGKYDIARVYKQVRKQLLAEMDKVSPDYAKARKIFSTYSEEVDKQTVKMGSFIGKLAKLEGDDISTASTKLFSKNPQVISRIRNMVTKENPKAWDNVVESYFMKSFKSVSEGNDTVVNWAGKLRNKLSVQLGQREKAEAILGKGTPAYRNFESFFGVLKKIAPMAGRESATASRKEMANEASYGIVPRTLRMIAQPLYTGKRWMADKALWMRSEHGQKKMVSMLLDTKETPKQLALLKRLSPKGEKFWDEFGILLGFTAREGHKALEKKEIGSSL